MVEEEEAIDSLQNATAVTVNICCEIVQSGSRFAAKIGRMLNSHSRETPSLASLPHRGRGPGCDSSGRRRCRGAARKSRKRRKIKHSD